MRVSGITPQGDWRFGKGRSQYKTKASAVRQNVLTRIRSFQNDWYADMSHGIDWIAIMGQRGNRQTIIRELERIILETPGVGRIERLEIVALNQRTARFDIKITTLFDETFEDRIEVEP